MKHSIHRTLCKGGTPGYVLSAEKQYQDARERALELKDVFTEIQDGGSVTYRDLADQLNKKGIPTARGKSWHASTVRRSLLYITEVENQPEP